VSHPHATSQNINCICRTETYILWRCRLHHAPRKSHKKFKSTFDGTSYTRLYTPGDARRGSKYNAIDATWPVFNHLTPNGHFSGRTAPLTSSRCILYIYSTNIRTENFKHAAHSPFFPLQNAVYFIMLPFFGSCIIHILYTECAKI
jgi:hypothetical protein